MEPTGALAIAKRYTDSITGKSGHAEPDIFAAEVSIWKNVSPEIKKVSGPAFATALAGGKSEYRSKSIDNYRVEVDNTRETSDGFIVQFAVRGTAHDGSNIAAYVSQIITLDKDRRITRFEEYEDLGQHQYLLAADRESGWKNPEA